MPFLYHLFKWEGVYCLLWSIPFVRAIVHIFLCDHRLELVMLLRMLTLLTGLLCTMPSFVNGDTPVVSDLLLLIKLQNSLGLVVLSSSKLVPVLFLSCLLCHFICSFLSS